MRLTYLRLLSELVLARSLALGRHRLSSFVVAGRGSLLSYSHQADTPYERPSLQVPSLWALQPFTRFPARQVGGEGRGAQVERRK